MAYRLASELSDRIAAIAPVAGPMGTETCNPKRPVPVIHFHGTDDQVAPFKGGKGDKSLSETTFFSVEHSINAWLKANGCKNEAVITRVPDKTKDGTTIVRKAYVPGKEGAEVILVIIEEGGHTWPGRTTLTFPWNRGISTRNISTNDWLWEFFKKHPMK
jgi:polyhydroxybutyrate depolymerase